MKNVYVIQKVEPGSTEYNPCRQTIRDAAKKALSMCGDLFADNIATYETEQEAIDAAKGMKWDARIDRCCVGYALYVYWHEIIQVTLDDDGDEVDVENLGSYDIPSVDDIVDMFTVEDDEEDEEYEEDDE